MKLKYNEKPIVGIGEILWDLLPNGKVLGGAPANFVYHVSQFGFDGLVVSAIGNDDLGDEILRNLYTKKMLNHLQKNDFPTGTVNVTIDEKGIPQYEICENVAWENIGFTPEIKKLAQSTKAVCFGSLAQRNNVSRTTIHRFLDLLPAGALKVFDINLRQHFYSNEVIESSLQKCNILKINDEEIVLIAKMFNWKHLSETDICKKILNDYSLTIVILTKGSEGSCIFTANETYFKTTPKIKLADTVGAGDAFTAAFIASLLKNKTIAQAHEKAVQVSAYVCTQFGATPPVPDYLTVF